MQKHSVREEALIEALHKILVKAGILDPNIGVTGPELLTAAEELINSGRKDGHKKFGLRINEVSTDEWALPLEFYTHKHVNRRYFGLRIFIFELLLFVGKENV